MSRSCEQPNPVQYIEVDRGLPHPRMQWARALAFTVFLHQRIGFQPVGSNDIMIRGGIVAAVENIKRRYGRFLLRTFRGVGVNEEQRKKCVCCCCWLAFHHNIGYKSRDQHTVTVPSILEAQHLRFAPVSST